MLLGTSLLPVSGDCAYSSCKNEGGHAAFSMTHSPLDQQKSPVAEEIKDKTEMDAPKALSRVGSPHQMFESPDRHMVQYICRLLSQTLQTSEALSPFPTRARDRGYPVSTSGNKLWSTTKPTPSNQLLRNAVTIVFRERTAADVDLAALQRRVLSAETRATAASPKLGI